MGLLSGLGFSQYINGRSKALGTIYSAAYNQLLRDLNDNASTLWQRDRATAMLARVDSIVQSLDAETKRFVDKEVPAVYFTTAKEAKKQIRALKIRVPDAFGQIHTQATEAMAKDAMLKFGHTMVGVKRSAEEYIKVAQQKAIRTQIAAGQITGKSAEEIAKEVKGTIQDQGITALIDKGGKRWQLDTYAEMLTRQMLANSGRDGVVNMAQEYGLDLAQVSVHNSDHPECAIWEGKIISLTGKTPGFPTLEDVTDEGLFHVGCRHGYAIVSGIGKDSPAKFGATISGDDGKETVPFPDADTRDAFKAMKYEPGDKNMTIQTEEGLSLPLRNGEMHRWIDDAELQSIIDTGKLSPTPENKALEASGGYYGRPGHKDFAMAPDSGKIFLENLQASSAYKGSGMHHIVLHADDIPDRVKVHTDTRTSASVSLEGNIPMQNLSIVESIGSKIVPGAEIDWKKVKYE